MGEEKTGRERTSSRFHAVSTEPKVGFNVGNCEITTRAQIKSWMLNRLSHPGTPGVFFVLMKLSGFLDDSLVRAGH